MKSRNLKRISCFAYSACTVLLAGCFASCEDDLLTGTPSWLNGSIYETLENDGNYKTTLLLADDPALNYGSVLKQTGSKTLFVADDEAYANFFKNNAWGVKSYHELTTAQKKLLFNSSLINNAYLIELLSSVSGDPPKEGKCMRRVSAVSLYDSISRIYPIEMPNTPYWSWHRTKENEGMLLIKDNTTTPMIHFLPEFMKTNNITSTDYEILTNKEANDITLSYVNGQQVVEENITCQNGYIHKVNEVMVPLDNMAQIISDKAVMSDFGKLLERYGAPYYDASVSENYNRIYNSENNRKDSVFVKRYFSKLSSGNSTNAQDPDGNIVANLLKFDPGWNTYMYTNTNGMTMDYDCGVMLVPSNEALEKYWNTEGKALRDEYGTWENVPDNVLVELINNLMVSSFIASVPSKFDAIVNDASEEMGVKPENVDSCFIGCNGVIYLLNKVFPPAAYQSVSFPALIHSETMNVIYWAVKNLEFSAYLNSMDSYYSFIIPTNKAMLRYIDPVSYGQVQPILYEFFYDNEKQTVGAHRYKYDLEINDTIPGGMLKDATTEQVRNRLNDLMNNLIVVGNIEDGKNYYITKGGSPIRIEGKGEGMKLYGSYQVEKESPMMVSTIYDQTETGNGKSYVIEDAPLMTTSKSVYDIMREDTCYSEFLSLLEGSSFLAKSIDGYITKNNAITLFNNYHYTIYAPQNHTIRELLANKLLPTWEEIETLREDEENYPDIYLRDSLVKEKTAIIENFLRYHIQDNAIYLGGGSINANYETSKLDEETMRFYKLSVLSDGNNLQVKDAAGHTRKVITQGSHSNKLAREYKYCKGTNATCSDIESAENIYNSSYAVVHLIDAPLYYTENQLKKTDYNKTSKRVRK